MEFSYLFWPFGHVDAEVFPNLTLGMIFLVCKKYQNKGYNGQHRWAKWFRLCQVYCALFAAAAKSYKCQNAKKICQCNKWVYIWRVGISQIFWNAMFQGPYPVILEVFRMLNIHWRGFSNGGIYILFLCSFQQFYRFFLFPTFNTCNFLPFNNFSKLKSFFFSSKFDEGSFHAQHLFSQLRIISIPWCMEKGAVISEWNPEILKFSSGEGTSIPSGEGTSPSPFNPLHACSCLRQPPVKPPL